MAGKPVMEGKGCLFRKFAGIDVFDIEVDETDPDKLVEIVASLEPTFGGINLEDIKAPECFLIETKLRERMKIPVFHDDSRYRDHRCGGAPQRAQDRRQEDRRHQTRLLRRRRGCNRLLNIVVGLGVQKKNIFVTDSKGVIYKGRADSMDDQKAQYAQDTSARNLSDIIDDADVSLASPWPACSRPTW